MIKSIDNSAKQYQTTLITWFEKNCLKYPNTIAVTYANQKLSFEVLNQKANQLSHYLLKQGTKSGDIIGVYFKNDLELIISILAILKSRAAYLPIDVRSPKNRVKLIVKESRISRILTSNMLSKKLSYLKDQKNLVISVDTLKKSISEMRNKNVNLKYSSSDLAYVIYTSGTTGKPKGVTISNFAITHHMRWMISQFNFETQDRFLQKTAYSFDASVWEIFTPILCGGLLILAPDFIRLNTQKMIQMIQKEEITVLQLVPCIFREFVKFSDPKLCQSLRLLFVGGEALCSVDSNHFIKKFKSTKLYNLYGLTETTINSSFFSCKDTIKNHTVPIGKPISSIRIYILNEKMTPVRKGDIGELYISGPTLARGYLNDNELTQKQFISNPFTTENTDDQYRRLYKTGDLARYLPDGNIEYIGRNDDQIKIRGYRVELNEINEHIRKYRSVDQSVVMAKDKGEGKKSIIAYVVSKKKLTESEITTHLSNFLPEYMIPSRIFFLDKFPLLSNGKINRNSLLNLKSENKIKYKSLTRTEGKLRNIFSVILAEPESQISIEHHYINMGCDSLSMMMLANRITAEFNIDDTVFLNSSCIHDLAKKIDGQIHHHNQTLPNSFKVKSNLYSLSHAQKRLYLLATMNENSLFYHIPVLYKIRGKFNHLAFTKAMESVLKRHEILRARFISTEKGIQQQIIPFESFKYDLSPKDTSELPKKEIANIINGFFHQKLYLDTGPLFITKLLKNNNNEHIFLVKIHHIITDGWSTGVFNQELSEFYNCYLNNSDPKLISTPCQYINYITWEKQRLSPTLLKNQESYWVEKLKNLTELNLQTDYPRPTVQQFFGDRITFHLSKNILKQLEGLAKAEKVTLFTLLLSLFDVIFYKYTGQHDISIGTPVANRRRTDFEKSIGLFVNTLVIRSNLSDNPTFSELLQRNHQTTDEAYQHQDLPFNQLVKVLCPERKLDRNPLFQVMLILEPNNTKKLSLPNLDVSTNEVNIQYALFDLAIFFKIDQGQLSVTVEYNSSLFKPSTIRRLTDHAQTLFNTISTISNTTLSDISILPEKEKRKLLFDWNNTTQPYPSDSLHKLLEKKALSIPESIAIIDKSTHEKYTYSKLNAKVNQFAYFLRSIGVTSGSRIAVYCNTSSHLIITLFALLKNGAVYIPIDIKNPTERVNYILNDSKADRLVTHHNLIENLPYYTNKVILIDNLETLISPFGTENPNNTINHSSTIYIMYTSGSTGNPKGVEATYQGVANNINWMQSQFQLTHNDIVLQRTSIGFDVSFWELCWTLTSGACLFMAPLCQVNDPYTLTSIISDNHITVAVFVPSILDLFLNHIDPKQRNDLRDVITIGEELTSKLQKKFYEKLPLVELYNLYGPTEASISVSAWHCQRNDKRPFIPIGKPIANTKLYVISNDLNLAPIGIVGELFIGGIGLAKGYFNQPQITSNAFTSNPFSSDPDDKIYRTGDLAYWLPDGNLVYLGRKDGQIKFNGHRVEIGEIETTLQAHPQVESSAVIDIKKPDGTLSLAAFIVPKLLPLVNSITLDKKIWETSALNYWNTIWQTIYNDNHSLHQQESQYDLKTNGWNSSYTNQPFSDAEMKDWRDATVQRLLRLQPKQVLEVGCGTGLLLFAIAPHCKHFHGTDFSLFALNYIKQQLDKHLANNVSLTHRHAEQVADDEKNRYDLVILNSVAQYFPSLDYLLTTIRSLLPAVCSAGKIFIGDVRDYTSLEVFHASVKLHHLTETINYNDWLTSIQHQKTHEKELLISPNFFRQLPSLCPDISAVEILLKHGKYTNEMSSFRYDVILYINTPTASTQPDKVLHWEKDHLCIDSIKDILISKQYQSLDISTIPNSRIYPLAKYIQKIKSTKTIDLDCYNTALSTLGKNTPLMLNPNKLYRLAEQLGYDAIIKLNNTEPNCMNVIFYQRAITQSKPAPQLPLFNNDSQAQLEGQELAALGNQPINIQKTYKLTQTLRENLRKKLPEHMIPATFTFIAQLPITLSGKLDKAELAARHYQPPIITYASPRNDIERQLAAIWQELLNLPQVSIFDRFFDIGGHSLLTFELSHQIQKHLAITLSITHIFHQPTIAELAQLIKHKFPEVTEKNPAELETTTS